MAGMIGINGEPREMDNYSLFIKNIPKEMTPLALKNCCSEYGEIKRWFVKEIEGSILYAIFCYADTRMASEALSNLQNKPCGWTVSYKFKNDHLKKLKEYQNRENVKRFNNSYTARNESNVGTPKTTSDTEKESSKNISCTEDSWDLSAEKKIVSPKNHLLSNKSEEHSIDILNIYKHDFSVFQNLGVILTNLSNQSKCKCVPCWKHDFSHVHPEEEGHVSFTFRHQKCHMCNKFMLIVKMDNVSINTVKSASMQYEKKSTEEKETSNYSCENSQTCEVAALPKKNDFDKQNRAASTLPKNYPINKHKPNKYSPENRRTFNRINETKSNSINDIPKSVFKLFTSDMKILLRPVSKLNDGSFLCLINSVDFKNEHDLLLQDLHNACTKVKGNSAELNAKGQMMAACVNEDGQKAWYRALQLPDNMFAFVDSGTVYQNSDITQLIACPQKFRNIPIFACVFKPARSSFVSKDFQCKVYENTKDKCSIIKVGETEPIGSLHDWPVIFRYQKQPENSQTLENRENRDIVEKKESSMLKLPVLKKKNVTPNKTQNRTQIESGSDVIIVKYFDSKKVFIRKAEEHDKRQYDMIVNDVHKAGLNASPLTNRLKTSMKVLVMHDKLYRRGCIKKYVHNCITVFLYDLGIKIETNYEDLRKMDKTVEDFNEPLVCISLMDQERISKDEPINEVIQMMNKHIVNETVFNCTYEGSDSLMPKNVILVSKESRENLNNTLTAIVKPLFEKLKEGKINTRDLPVIMYTDMKFLQLDTNASISCPTTLLLINTVEFAKSLYIACTPANYHTKDLMRVLSKRINDYCAVQTEHCVPIEGEMCLVLYDKDKLWYRAIAFLNETDSVKIEAFLIDIAVYTLVEIKNVKKMMPEFVDSLPIYALKCFIKGFPEQPSSKMITETLNALKGTEIISASSVVYSSENKDDDEGIYTIEIPYLTSMLRKKNILF